MGINAVIKRESRKDFVFIHLESSLTFLFLLSLPPKPRAP